MKTAVVLALIIVGGVLIAAPVAAVVFDSSNYQSILLEYFQRFGNGAPTNSLAEARANPAYFWFCGLVGLVFVTIGIRVAWERTRSSAT